MLFEDNLRYNIWKRLKDPFDYNEFCKACEAEDVTPMLAMDFAVKVGRIMVGRSMYPDIPELEAYTKIYNEHSVSPVHPLVHKQGPKGIVVVRDSLSPNADDLPSNKVSGKPFLYNSLPPKQATKEVTPKTGQTSCCGGGKVR